MKYLFILALGLIVYISFNSTFINPYLFEGADKIKHIIAFLILSFFLFGSFEKIKGIYKIYSLVIFACVIEVAQSFVGRESSIVDFIASCFGIFLYLLIAQVKKENRL